MFAIVAGLATLHEQARRMSSTLSALADSGAIVAREEIFFDDSREVLDHRSTFELNRVTRILGIDRVARRSTPEAAFGDLIERVNKICSKCRIAVALVSGFLAWCMAIFLHLGETTSFFSSLAPHHRDRQAIDAWTRAAYEAWWASVDHHWTHKLYLAYAFIAFYIILMFHLTGACVLYIIYGMRHLTQSSADWSNYDGCFGWRPVADVYRTVVFAVFLLSCAITVMLVMLGLRYFWFVAVAVALYVGVTPLFLIVPRIIWADVAETAKKSRIRELQKALTSRIDTRNCAILAEMDRCRSSDISPLRLTTVWMKTSFVTAVVIPVTLAVVQVVFPVVLAAD
ncbi:hypothetical protein [Mycobacterium novum]